MDAGSVLGIRMAGFDSAPFGEIEGLWLSWTEDRRELPGGHGRGRGMEDGGSPSVQLRDGHAGGNSPHLRA